MKVQYVNPEMVKEKEVKDPSFWVKDKFGWVSALALMEGKTIEISFCRKVGFTSILMKDEPIIYKDLDDGYEEISQDGFDSLLLCAEQRLRNQFFTNKI